MAQTIYLLTGRGGSLSKGLGAELSRRGFNVAGRELQGDFTRLPFADQVDTVSEDLREHFWREDARVIASSFGAYLFLQAQAQLSPYPGRVLLLSPIVGEAVNEEHMRFFVPPRAQRLKDVIHGNQYPKPAHIEIHVGENDWQSNPTNVLALGIALDIPVIVVPAGEHRLDRAYVSQVLDAWLESPFVS
jgi:hypothetical protein